MEITPQSIQQTTFDHFHKLIKEQSGNMEELKKIIVLILAHPSVNTYSDFLQLPELSALKDNGEDKYYTTLNLFAFGTYLQYLENKEKLIALTPYMEKKLKHLTILTLATQKKTLPYDDLMIQLDLKNVRHLEDLIIEAIYAELINGKLDQKNRQLEIDYAVARDIQTENIQEIITILGDWLKSCESCSNCLQDQIETANAEKAKRMKHKEKLEEQLAEVKKNIKKQSNQQNFDDQESEYMMGTEKNLNSGGSKRSGGKNKPGSSKNWFKNFN